MNRRGFLGNLLAGAAAVLGASVVAPKAEAAEQTDGMTEPAYLWFTDSAIEHGDGPTGWYGLGKFMIDGVAVSSQVFGEWLECSIADRAADAYNRGIAVAEARAESRLAEGLPIRRGALEDVEIGEWRHSVTWKDLQVTRGCGNPMERLEADAMFHARLQDILTARSMS